LAVPSSTVRFGIFAIAPRTSASKFDFDEAYRPILVSFTLPNDSRRVTASIRTRHHSRSRYGLVLSADDRATHAHISTTLTNRLVCRPRFAFAATRLHSLCPIATPAHRRRSDTHRRLAYRRFSMPGNFRRRYRLPHAAKSPTHCAPASKFGHSSPRLAR